MGGLIKVFGVPTIAHVIYSNLTWTLKLVKYDLIINAILSISQIRAMDLFIFPSYIDILY